MATPKLKSIFKVQSDEVCLICDIVTITQLPHEHKKFMVGYGKIYGYEVSEKAKKLTRELYKNFALRTFCPF